MHNILLCWYIIIYCKWFPYWWTFKLFLFLTIMVNAIMMSTVTLSFCWIIFLRFISRRGIAGPEGINTCRVLYKYWAFTFQKGNITDNADKKKRKISSKGHNLHRLCSKLSASNISFHSLYGPRNYNSHFACEGTETQEAK